MASLLGFFSFGELSANNKSLPVSVMVPSTPRGTSFGLSLVGGVAVAMLDIKQGLGVNTDGILIGVAPEAVEVFGTAVSIVKVNGEVLVGNGTITPEGPGGMSRGVFCAASGNKLLPRIGIDFLEVIVLWVFVIGVTEIFRERSSFAEEDLKGRRRLKSSLVRYVNGVCVRKIAKHEHFASIIFEKLTPCGL